MVCQLWLQGVLNNATSTTVSNCGAQFHRLWTRPHNNGTDKSAKVGQSAERGNASHTGNHQGHIHWDHEVHARPPTNANQTESGAGQTYFTAVENPHNPLNEAVKDTKACKLGRGKSWMRQAEDSVLQVCLLTELKQTKEWERYPNRFRRLNETLLPENLGKHCRERPAGKTDQTSQSANRSTS